MNGIHRLVRWRGHLPFFLDPLRGPVLDLQEIPRGVGVMMVPELEAPGKGVLVPNVRPFSIKEDAVPRIETAIASGLHSDGVLLQVVGTRFVVPIREHPETVPVDVDGTRIDGVHGNPEFLKEGAIEDMHPGLRDPQTIAVAVPEDGIGCIRGSPCGPHRAPLDMLDPELVMHELFNDAGILLDKGDEGEFQVGDLPRYDDLFNGFDPGRKGIDPISEGIQLFLAQLFKTELLEDHFDVPDPRPSFT
jgi:hypothetical protein